MPERGNRTGKVSVMAMPRDVKVGIAIGVLLIALIAVFWWARSGDVDPRSAREAGETDLTGFGPSVEPVPPVPAGEAPSPFLPAAPEVAAPGATPTAAAPAAPAGVNPAASLSGPALPRAVQTPAGVAAPSVTAPPPAPQARTHEVVKGETLSSISEKYYGTQAKWKRILDANRALIPDANRLKVGIKLTIPDVADAAPAPGGLVPVTIPAAGGAASAARKHTVAAGESLSAISEKYYGTQAKWKTIYDANRSVISDPDRLRQGTELVIP